MVQKWPPNQTNKQQPTTLPSSLSFTQWFRPVSAESECKCFGQTKNINLFILAIQSRTYHITVRAGVTIYRTTQMVVSLGLFAKAFGSGHHPLFHSLCGLMVIMCFLMNLHIWIWFLFTFEFVQFRVSFVANSAGWGRAYLLYTLCTIAYFFGLRDGVVSAVNYGKLLKVTPGINYENVFIFR